MPIQPDLFNHLVMSTFFIRANHNVKENDEVDENSRENVKAVKASDKEEEVGKKWTSIFISNEVGSFDNMYCLADFIDRTLSIQYDFMPLGIILLGFNEQIVIGQKSSCDLLY